MFELPQEPTKFVLENQVQFSCHLSYLMLLVLVEWTSNGGTEISQSFIKNIEDE